jgi:hypothetical protein
MTASGKRLGEGGGGPESVIPARDEQHVAASVFDRDGRSHSRFGMGA